MSNPGATARVTLTRGEIDLLLQCLQLGRDRCEAADEGEDADPFTVFLARMLLPSLDGLKSRLTEARSAVRHERCEPCLDQEVRRRMDPGLGSERWRLEIALDVLERMSQSAARRGDNVGSSSIAIVKAILRGEFDPKSTCKETIA